MPVQFAFTHVSLRRVEVPGIPKENLDVRPGPLIRLSSKEILMQALNTFHRDLITLPIVKSNISRTEVNKCLGKE